VDPAVDATLYHNPKVVSHARCTRLLEFLCLCKQPYVTAAECQIKKFKKSVRINKDFPACVRKY
jgi:hypothetical protein